MILRSLHDTPGEGVSHDSRVRKHVLLRAGELPGVTQLARATLAPGERTQPHAHPDMYEVFWVEGGAGTLVVDGAAYPVGPGTCAVVAPGEVHEWASTGPDGLVLTYFGLLARGP